MEQTSHEGQLKRHPSLYDLPLSQLKAGRLGLSFSGTDLYMLPCKELTENSLQLEDSVKPDFDQMDSKRATACEESTSPLLVAKVVFFFAGISCSSMMPFMPAYMSHVGIRAEELGSFIALLPIAAIIGAPSWGLLARKTGSTKTLVSIVCFAGSCFIALLALPSVQQSRLKIRVCIFFGGMCLSALHLVNSLVMSAVKGSSEGYGAQRLWQSVGWGTGSLVCGRLIDTYGVTAMFVLHVAGTASYALVVQWLPEKRIVQVERVGESPSLLETIKRPEVRWLLSNLVAHAMLITLVNAFLGTFYLEVLGASKTIIGVAQLVNTLSEIPLLFLSDVLLARVGMRGAFTLAHVGFALRVGAIALVPVGAAGATLKVVAISCLHGVMISIFQAASTTAVEELAPGNPLLHALNGALVSALAPAFGAVIWSCAWGVLGPQNTFALGSILALLWSLLWNLSMPLAAKQSKED